MKKVLLFCIAVLVTVCVNAQYQLPNGDFENWPDANSVPSGWHTFNTATGSLASMVTSAVQHERAAGHTGQYSCCIKPRNVFLGIIANGNFTTGRINAGSMTASDYTGNYNFSDITNGYCQTFVGYPDSISFWASLYATSSSLEASLTATIHSNYAMHDPIDDNSKAVASMTKHFSRTTSSSGSVVWQNYRTKFNYDDYLSYNQTSQYILISFTTNKEAGQGNTSDRLYVDDIEMIYVGEMTDIKVNGTTIANFNQNTYSYEMCFSGTIPTVTATAASSIANTKNQVSITQASASNNYTATINRLGSDISYTIHFIPNPDITLNVPNNTYSTCPGEEISVTASGANSYSWSDGLGNDATVHPTTSGIYTVTGTDIYGCSNTTTLTINIYTTFSIDTNISVCDNDLPFVWNNNSYTESGNYDLALQTVNGCDSILHLHLHIAPNVEYYNDISVCDNQLPYLWHGMSLTEPGTYSDTIDATDGCDSIFTILFSINPTYEVYVSDSAMMEHEYIIENFSVTPADSGTYEYDIQSYTLAGCDSIIHLTLYIAFNEGVDDFSMTPEFDFFPNPTNAQLNIRGERMARVEVFGIDGRLLFSGTPDSPEFTAIDVTPFAAGHYTVRITLNDGKTVSGKIVINR